MIEKLLEGSQISPTHSPPVSDKSIYETLVNMGNGASSSPEPPPKSCEQVQLVLNSPLLIAAFKQRRCERPKVEF